MTPRWLWILGALALSAGPAAAADYWLVASSPTQIVVVDAESIETVKPGVKRAASVSIRSPAAREVNNAYVEILSEYDCVGRRMRPLRASVYARNQELVRRSATLTRSWVPAGPKTQGAEALEFVCAGSPERTGVSRLDGLTLSDIVESIFDGPWPAGDEAR
jgi:hypothetical protein